MPFLGQSLPFLDLSLRFLDLEDVHPLQFGCCAVFSTASSFSKRRLVAQPGGQVVIACCFRAAAAAVREGLAAATGERVEILTGETPVAARGQSVDRFQVRADTSSDTSFDVWCGLCVLPRVFGAQGRGVGSPKSDTHSVHRVWESFLAPLNRVSICTQAGESRGFVLTCGAGGLGVTLTAASTMVLLDRPLTPVRRCAFRSRVATGVSHCLSSRNVRLSSWCCCCRATASRPRTGCIGSAKRAKSTASGFRSAWKATDTN